MFGALVRFALLNNITDDTVVSFDGTSTTTPPTGLLFGRVAEQSIPSYRRQGAHEGTLTGAIKGAICLSGNSCSSLAAGVRAYSAWSPDEAGWNTWVEHALWRWSRFEFSGALMCRLNKLFETVVSLGCAC